MGRTAKILLAGLLALICLALPACHEGGDMASHAVSLNQALVGTRFYNIDDILTHDVPRVWVPDIWRREAVRADLGPASRPDTASKFYIQVYNVGEILGPTMDYGAVFDEPTSQPEPEPEGTRGSIFGGPTTQPAPDPKVTQLIDWIRSQVEPDSWAPRGQANIKETDRLLVVKQTARAHQTLASLLIQRIQTRRLQVAFQVRAFLLSGDLGAKLRGQWPKTQPDWLPGSAWRLADSAGPQLAAMATLSDDAAADALVRGFSHSQIEPGCERDPSAIHFTFDPHFETRRYVIVDCDSERVRFLPRELDRGPQGASLSIAAGPDCRPLFWHVPGIVTPQSPEGVEAVADASPGANSYHRRRFGSPQGARRLADAGPWKDFLYSGGGTESSEGLEAVADA
jgi:hypothetical protein